MEFFMEMYTKKGYLNSEFRLFHLTDRETHEIAYHYHDFDKITIEKHYRRIKQYVDEVFRHSWPDADRNAVSDQALADIIHNTSGALTVVVKRLYRRLHWAYDEIRRLNEKRLTPGTLREDDQAHFRRCDNLIKKFKGQLINKRKTDSKAVL